MAGFEGAAGAAADGAGEPVPDGARRELAAPACAGLACVAAAAPAPAAAAIAAGVRSAGLALPVLLLLGRALSLLLLGRGGLVVPVLGTGGLRLARGRGAVAVAVGLVRLRLAVGLAGGGRLGLRGCRGRLGLARLGRGLARLLALGTSAVLLLGRRAGSGAPWPPQAGRLAGGDRHAASARPAAAPPPRRASRAAAVPARARARPASRPRLRARAPGLPIRAGASRPAPARSRGLRARRARPLRPGRRRRRFPGRSPARVRTVERESARRRQARAVPGAQPGVQPPWTASARSTDSSATAAGQGGGVAGVHELLDPREGALDPLGVERRAAPRTRSSRPAWAAAARPG